jgi:GGDEF domain-containing protein
MKAKQMIERRVDHVTRKRVAQMSPEEMRRLLLTSEKTGLPNRRAFDESDASPFVAMADVNGLKGLNDQYGYAAGDTLIRRLAEILRETGLDAYHDKGDEFICRGRSFDELDRNLCWAQHLLKTRTLTVRALDGSTAQFDGADFCFGIGQNIREAEKRLKHQKRRKGSSRTALPSYVSLVREFCRNCYKIFLRRHQLEPLPS